MCWLLNIPETEPMQPIPLLRKHLKRLGLADSAHCECGSEEQTPEHILHPPTPGDSAPTVLASRHWSGHQALGASCQTTADSGLPSSHWPEDLSRSSHRRQNQLAKERRKKKNSHPHRICPTEKSKLLSIIKRKPSSTARLKDTTQTRTRSISWHDTNRPSSLASEQATADWIAISRGLA